MPVQKKAGNFLNSPRTPPLEASDGGEAEKHRISPNLVYNDLFNIYI